MCTATPRTSQGFTLLELMVVVALIGVLTMLAAPSISLWLQNIRIRNASEAMLNGMQTARMEAMRRNTRVTFWMVSSTDAGCALSSTGPSWIITLGAAPPTSLSNGCANAVFQDGGSTVQRYTASAAMLGIDLTAQDAAAAATNCITFDGLGQVPTQGNIACASPIEQIDMTSALPDTVALRVTVTTGGQARMCYPDPANQLKATDPRKC